MNGETRVSCQQGFTDGEIEKTLHPWGDNERDRAAENGYRPLDRLYTAIVVAVVAMLAVDVTAIENERHRAFATKDRFVLETTPRSPQWDDAF